MGHLVHGRFDDTPTANQVYNLVKSRRLNQLSFAYDTIGSAPVKTGGGDTVNELRGVRLYEVSLVPVGANQDTSVVAVKSAVSDRASTDTLALRLRILSVVT